MKKFYAFAAAAMLAVSANAQDALYAVGAGEGLGWDPKAPKEFTFVQGEGFVLEIADLTQLKISTTFDAEAEGDGWPEFNAGVLGCNYGSEQGVAVTLEEGYADNIAAPWKGNYTITVSADLSTITLSTDTPKPDENALPEIYVRGDMNSWGTDEAWMMTAITKEMFKFQTGADQKIAAGDGFKIADADWNAYNIGGNGEDIDLDAEYEVFNGGNPANMALASDFEGTIYLRLNYQVDEETTMSLIYFSTDGTVPEWFEDGGSNVAEIAAAAEGEAQYFTLQGVRVANPENGLYIVVKGGKSYKTILK
ncbi:MAG: hypothetical protein HDR80_10295 [Bacteroides sp.]|nr:hypothetical protein [Bacteroides sp.]MBD5371510.1 hypothetical protein [Bacteroides sp.]